MAEGKRHDEIQGEILHVYDGIEEADNQLPLWWLLTFYGAIAFGIVYWFYYQEFGIGNTPLQDYNEVQIAAAASSGKVTAETLAFLGEDPSAVTSGATTFMSQCIACHGTKAEGVVGLGPNLTDNRWIHGGDPLDIYTTIDTGVPEKGMLAWGPILGSGSVKQLVAYILSIRDTNVPGKPPEGEVWEP